MRINPTAMLDVQIKRIHEYKRQLLNILETVALYQAIRKQPNAAWVPRVKIIAGKAAASYARAKLIIQRADRRARPPSAIRSRAWSRTIEPRTRATLQISTPCPLQRSRPIRTHSNCWRCAVRINVQ